MIEFGRCAFCGKLGFLKLYNEFIFQDVPLCNECYQKPPLEHLGFKFPKQNATLHIEWYDEDSWFNKKGE